MEAVTKIDDCFTVCQYKAEKPKNIEIFMFLEVWLFWFETNMRFLDSK